MQTGKSGGKGWGRESEGENGWDGRKKIWKWQDGGTGEGVRGKAIRSLGGSCCWRRRGERGGRK